MRISKCILSRKEIAEELKDLKTFSCERKMFLHGLNWREIISFFVEITGTNLFGF